VDATGWAAIATGASAVVVGYQSWQTKRAADAARATANDAEETLSLARNSQASTERSVHYSQLVALEAARQRRDVRLPSLHIDTSTNPVRVFRVGVDGPEREPLSDASFRLPDDNDQKVMAMTTVTVRVGEGSPAVTLAYHGDLEPWARTPGSAGGDSPTVAAGESRDLRFSTTRTVEEWVAIADVREQGNPGPENSAMVVLSDLFDDGVIDRYELCMGGTPLHRRSPGDSLAVFDMSPTNALGWLPVAVSLTPGQRQYFVSKVANHELPSPSPWS